MRRLAQFLCSNWEEIPVTGIWLPFILASVPDATPVMIALRLAGRTTSFVMLYALPDTLSRHHRPPTFEGKANGGPKYG